MAEYKAPILTVAVLSFNKEQETRLCLESLRRHLKVPESQIVLLENGSEAEYPWAFYREGLCDVVIIKRRGCGGGVGQTDLFRFSPSPYTLFVQCDQVLQYDITPKTFIDLMCLLEPLSPEDNGHYQVVDLNGDQSGRGVWTDRAHLVKTEWFNGLGPFPNGGPGLDDVPWNEAYLQTKVTPRRICHVQPTLFRDIGKWSVREAGDGLYRHECDTKRLYILKKPTYRTEVYPPFNDAEWERVLAGQWVDGDIPEQWKPHSFTVGAWQ